MMQEDIGYTYAFLRHIPRVNFYENGLNYIPRLYYAKEHPRQYLECFYKEGCTNMPVVLWIHGGAWDDEYLTASYRPENTLAELAKQGYFIACLEYRLSRHAPLPACLEDCGAALAFLRDHASELQIDSRKIGLWGESAGAHIACMTASNYDGRTEKNVQCVVSFYCPSNLWKMAQDMGEELGFLVNVLPGGTLEKSKQKKIFEKMSPITYADQKDLPPMLMFHGREDSVVPYVQSIEYADKLKHAGNQVELILVPEQGHGFFEGKENYEKIIDFFKTNCPVQQRSSI